MSIVRVKKRDHPFVQIDKRCLEDNRLSWKTKGILAYLLSRPDDWVVRFEQLQTVSKDGKSSIRSAFKELSDLGYCERVPKQVIDEDGRSVLMGSEYVVYELPNPGRSESSDVKDPRGSENLTVRESHTTNKDTLTNNEVDINKNTNNSESSNFDQAEPKREMKPCDIWRDSNEEIDRKVGDYSDKWKTVFFVDAWNKIYKDHMKVELKPTDKKHKQVMKKLAIYKPSMIIMSLKNRANDQWLKDEGIMGEWNKFWEFGDKVEEYINRDYTKKAERKTNMPDYGYNMPRDFYR